MSASYSNGVNSGSAASSRSPGSSKIQNAAIPPPKTDKPRPHICATCTRSFARLEHLKRHERSHTKEKPFECPECTRCFARRDLLLRHQQKLHMTTTPSTRPRAGARRESTSSVASTGGRVRKNSVSTAAVVPISNGDGGAATMRARPRANTIAHVDTSTLGMMAAANANANRGRSLSGISTGIGNSGLVSVNQDDTRYVFPEIKAREWGTWAHGQPRHMVPKLDTSLSSLDLGGLMPRSATVIPSELDLEGILFGTVNPAALHLNMSPLQQPIGTPTSPFGPPYSGVDSSYYSVEEEDDYEWMNVLGGGSLMSEPLDQSSPSAFSTTSASGISEVVLNENMWQGQMMNSNSSVTFSTPNFNDSPPPPNTVSPKSLMAPTPTENFYSHDQLSVSPSGMTHGFSSGYNQYETPEPSNNSFFSADSITEATRLALLSTLSHHTGFPGGNHNYPSQRNQQRRYSTSAASSPIMNTFSPNPTTAKHSPSLPSTRDLQRYVTSYIKYFHPHLPFLHIPTLNFDSSTFTSSYKAGQRNGTSGGGGSLILSMAAIGALYEFETAVARDIFEAAKKTIQIFLDDRRKADVTAALNGLHRNANASDASNNTPVWLVQAMLLNVIFGIQCGDRTTTETAITHCAALVSLARAAGLTRQAPSPNVNTYRHDDGDIQMGDLDMGSFSGSVGSDGWDGLGIKMEADQNVEWTYWVAAEERKRTLYAVHFLSSLLVAAHNLPPALMNNEIRLDLPCNEELWTAETAADWNARGGWVAASQRSVNFATALNGLLSAGQQQFVPHGQFQHFANGQQGGIPPYPALGIVPSTFGCLILICALHVYIWETRQRHNARQWSPAEAEAMHAHIEPALKAWQAAWYSSPHHSIERPNPFSMGPLSADSIPLLDLAYIRLFVDLGRAKEFFWSRDFEAMAEELARGWENMQNNPSSSASSVSCHSDSSFSGAISPASSPGSGSASTSPSPHLHPIKIEPVTNSSLSRFTTSIHPNNMTNANPTGSSSKREKHLRKAAFYAADSLAMSDTLGVSNAGNTACRELPIQSALCTFDCAQVLAEWLATVQERVGPFMGILGSEHSELECVEGLMCLESEDRKLLGKVMEMLRNAEGKMNMEWGQSGGNQNALRTDGGLGPKVLRVSAYLLDKAVVWPATSVMAQALRAQADHMGMRINNSILPHHN
ncbi:hypothetical protein RUND412_007654 [Rhizina undulata]